VIIATVLIVTGIVLLIIFMQAFSPLNLLDTLEVALVVCLLIFAGFAVGFSLKIKSVVGVFLVLIVWSLGFLVIPVPPPDEGDAVYGGYFLLLVVLIAAYGKFTHRKKAQLDGKITN